MKSFLRFAPVVLMLTSPCFVHADTAATAPAKILGTPSSSPTPSKPEAVDGYFDAKWGDSHDVVVKKLTDAGYTFESSKDNVYKYEAAMDTNINGVAVYDVAVTINSSGFVKAAIDYAPTAVDTDVLSHFTLLRELLTPKYGEPTSVVDKIDNPIYNALPIVALQSGAGHYSCQWKAATSAGDPVTVTMEIPPTLEIALTYQDDKLAADPKN